MLAQLQGYGDVVVVGAYKGVLGVVWVQYQVTLNCPVCHGIEWLDLHCEGFHSDLVSLVEEQFWCLQDLNLGTGRFSSSLEQIDWEGDSGLT